MSVHRILVLAQMLLLQSVVVHVSVGQEHESDKYATTLKAIEEAKTLTYTVTFYSQLPGEEGETPQFQPVSRSKSVHQVPNLYRETRFDPQGNVNLVEIVDTTTKKSLLLDMKSKRATWMNSPINVYGPGSPLEMLANFVRKMPAEPVGQREVSGCKADVFRLKGVDIWLDTESKRLVGISIPGADRFDPLPADAGKAVAVSAGGRAVGQIRSDIVYGAPLDKALFDMTPPEGFTVVEAAPRFAVSEETLVEWLGVAARFNDNAFFDTDKGYASKRLNAARKKNKKDRTKPEQDLIVFLRKQFENGNWPVTTVFIGSQTVPDSYRYRGKGVKLGSADHIVCWYRRKSDGKLRAVYGDLTVKYVAPEDLPTLVDE